MSLNCESQLTDFIYFFPCALSNFICSCSTVAAVARHLVDQQCGWCSFVDLPPDSRLRSPENLCLFPLFGAVDSKLFCECDFILFPLFWLALPADCNKSMIASSDDCIVCLKPLPSNENLMTRISFKDGYHLGQTCYGVAMQPSWLWANQKEINNLVVLACQVRFVVVNRVFSLRKTVILLIHSSLPLTRSCNH